jgi:hypothetical protein
MAISGVARTQGGHPVAVYYPFGHPTLYAYDNDIYVNDKVE